MAITSGISIYECDRCHYKSFLAEHDLETKSWLTVNRYDRNRQNTPVTFCPICAEDYTKYEKTHQDSFDAFMSEKTETKKETSVK